MNLKISQLPASTSLQGDESIALVQGSTTKQSTVQDIVNYNMTVYTALLTQSGTSAPVATILQNTTGGTITWTRTGAGEYTATIANALFTLNKTLVFMNLGEYSGGGIPRSVWTRTSNTEITINTGNDGRITNGSFEIKIYA